MDKSGLVLGLKYFQAAGLKNMPDLNNKKDFGLLLEVWSELLESVPNKVFVAACKLLASRNTFFPTLAEVREKCENLMEQQSSSGFEVFNKIKPLMFRISHAYTSDEDREHALNSIKDPVARAAAKSFDWKACGLDKESNLGFHRAHFVKLYEQCLKEKKFCKDVELIGVNTLGKKHIEGLIGTIGGKYESNQNKSRGELSYRS